MFLNILLLVVGSAATLSVFGGETWHKGRKPLFQRITLRGKISLLCLVVALSAGVLKEVLASQQTAERERARIRANADLRRATKSIASLERDLSNTKTQLAEQLQTNLLLGLSGTHSTNDATLILRPPVKVTSRQDLVQILFPDIPPDLRQLAVAQIEFWPSDSISASISLSYGPTGKLTEQDGTSTQPLGQAGCFDASLQIRKECADSGGRIVIFQKADINQAHGAGSVARASAVIEERSPLASVSFSLQKGFESEAEMRVYLQRHPAIAALLYEVSVNRQDDPTGPRWATFDIPNSLRNDLIQRWKMGASGSELSISIGDSLNLHADVSAELADPQTKGFFTVFLKASNKPQIRVDDSPQL